MNHDDATVCRPPIPGIYAGLSHERASLQAEGLLEAALRTGNWRHLPEHLAALRERLAPATDGDRAPPETPAGVHNRLAGLLVAAIVRPTLTAGGSHETVLVLLESVVVGVLTMAVKLGGDNAVLDVFMAQVRERMATLRLGDLPPAGQG